MHSKHLSYFCSYTFAYNIFFPFPSHDKKSLKLHMSNLKTLVCYMWQDIHLFRFDSYACCMVLSFFKDFINFLSYLLQKLH